MRNPLPLLSLITLAACSALGGEQKSTPSPMNEAVAKTPKGVSVAIVNTSWAMDGGSILNDIRFSDGRLYRISLDYPVDLVTNKLIYPQIHFTIYGEDQDRTHPETLKHEGPAERRLVELLEERISATADVHEKKNAASLVSFLKNRDQPFPGSHGGKWDLTRPKIEIP
jgi:hypothetical protein